MTSPTDDRPADHEPPGPAADPHRRSVRVALVLAAAALGLLLGVVLVTVGDDGEAPEATAAGEESRAAGTVADPGVQAGSTTIDVEQLDDAGAVRIEVSDPAAPAASGATSRVCVLVTYAMAPDATDETGFDRQTHGCADIGGTAALSIDPVAPAVGCAALAERQSLLASGAAPASATFTVTPTAPLQVGPFEVRVEAVTGYGDGCPPADDHGEHVASEAVGISVG
jgi:hypothetical protein